MADNLSESKEMSFEKALLRLEEILEKMNSGSVGLDESLVLFEEADQLIGRCNRRLSEAESRIQVLIKNRNGELALGQDEKPILQKFETM